MKEFEKIRYDIEQLRMAVPIQDVIEEYTGNKPNQSGMIECPNPEHLDVYHLDIGRVSVKDTAFLREITEIKGLDGRSIEEKIKGNSRNQESQ